MSQLQPFALKVFFPLVMPGAGMPEESSSHPSAFSHHQPKVYSLYFRVVAHDVRSLDFVWYVHCLFPGSGFLPCFATHSSTAEVSSSARVSINLFFSTSLHKAFKGNGRKACIYLFPPSSPLKCFFKPFSK